MPKNWVEFSLGRKMRKKNSQSGVAWIEVLVIAAILLQIASLFLRVRYGQAWLAAEYSFVQSVGINRDAYDIGKITVLSIVFACYAVYRFSRGRRHQ
jgi:hypothetical protein